MTYNINQQKCFLKLDGILIDIIFLYFKYKWDVAMSLSYIVIVLFLMM